MIYCKQIPIPILDIDITKIKRKLNWKPKIKIEDSINDLCSSIK